MLGYCLNRLNQFKFFSFSLPSNDQRAKMFAEGCPSLKIFIEAAGRKELRSPCKIAPAVDSLRMQLSAPDLKSPVYGCV